MDFGYMNQNIDLRDKVKKFIKENHLEFIDDFYLISEEDIIKTIKYFIENEKLLIEGAAAVAVSSFLNNSHLFRGMNIGIVICGGNIGSETLKSILWIHLFIIKNKYLKPLKVWN